MAAGGIGTSMALQESAECGTFSALVMSLIGVSTVVLLPLSRRGRDETATDPKDVDMNLALFPLKTVLFPGCILDLQIFEARYLDMITRSMKQGSGFGVVCILEGEEVGKAPESFARIGCEALVRDFEQQDNGLLGIRIEGGRRFRVLQTEVQRDQLILADVEWLEEVADQPVQQGDEDLLALLNALSEHPMVAFLEMRAKGCGQQALSYLLAYLLPFPDQEKIALLQLDDPQQRLDGIQSLLDKLQGELLV